MIERVEWRDQDGVPDFLIEMRGQATPNGVQECSIAAMRFSRTPSRSKIQKTRNQMGGGPDPRLQGRRILTFLAACLFNQTGKWKYLFSSTINLQRQPKHPDYLVIMQKVPISGSRPLAPTS